MTITNEMITFVDNDPDVQERTVELFDLYHEATKISVSTEHIAPALELIELGVDAKASITLYNQTLLHFAARYGPLEVIKSLLDDGADPNATPHFADPPIFMAIGSKNASYVSLLLEHGADPNTISQRYTPLGMVLERQPDNIKMIAALLRAGADVHRKNPIGGDTPLHVAARRSDLEFMRLLLARNADLHVINDMGMTPFVDAMNNGRGDAAELLLLRGANIHDRDYNGNSVMHYAAMRGTLQMLDTFLNAGAKINQANNDGLTPLAYGDMSYEVVKWFMARGASIQYGDLNLSKKEQEALHDDILRYIIKYRDGTIETPGDINHLVSIMQVANIKAIPEPRELIEHLFRTLPHTKNLNALYHQCLGHPRPAEATATLQDLRRNASRQISH